MQLSHHPRRPLRPTLTMRDCARAHHARAHVQNNRNPSNGYKTSRWKETAAILRQGEDR
jgi:hypothetical protein